MGKHEEGTGDTDSDTDKSLKESGDKDREECVCGVEVNEKGHKKDNTKKKKERGMV